MKNLKISRISSLSKVKSFDDIKPDVRPVLALPGEHVSYQVALETDGYLELSLHVESAIREYVKVYIVKDVVMDYPVNIERMDDDYITAEPGFMPDLLLPLEEQNWYIKANRKPTVFWIDVKLPRDYPADTYSVCLKAEGKYKPGVPQSSEEPIAGEILTEIEVIGENLPAQSTEFTQWFHADCIANVHNVPVYSEEHWVLIEKYIALAAELGITMILTPIFSPSMDIKEGRERTNVQLVGIEVTENGYRYDFSKVRRWISLCKKNGISTFEIAPLFTQWGIKYAPVIKAKKNGELFNLFGWDVPAGDPKYAAFLKDFLPKLIEVLKEEAGLDNCRFHISDEPHLEHLEAYRYAHDLVKPLLEGCETIDALSRYEFYEAGLVDIPVTAMSRSLEVFLAKGVKKQWIYHCCGQDFEVSNRFMAMPSHRTRVVGLQMYKYGISGFLQWGYNFYNSQLSLYPINPYMTSSSDRAFPSGDPFSVYPYKNEALPSLRSFIFREALQDIDLCRQLEKYIGKEAVVAMIEEEAGMELTFFRYPVSDDFIPDVILKIKKRIAEYTK